VNSSLVRVFLAVGASLWLIHALAHRHPLDPSLISDEPLQESVTGLKAWPAGKYRIRALARYDIHARVLHHEPYYADREADLSPLDFAVGWGPMSDPKVYPAFHFSQGSRWYFWKAGPLSNDVVSAHSANMHLIPASSEIKKQLGAVETGDHVRLTGYLIEASAGDGYSWTSSLSRTDTGSHSCEVMWVETVTTDP
jgi:hypothetical protein